MIIDLGKATTDPLPVYDLCIVGSGPAGLTVANELATSGLRICVLESGQLKFTKHGDILRQVKSEGIRIKDYSRERVLGGASTTWAGLASPLDPVDFQPRPFLNHSGWPISRDELLPYYEKATQDYGFASLKLFSPEGFSEVKAGNDRELKWTDLEEKTFLAAAKPQDFGRMFRSLFSQPGIDLYLDATLIRLESDDSAQRIARGVVCTSTGSRVTVEAMVFMIATGGIENARILLNSRDGCPQGLGNEHDQVGRCFMNHPKDPHGLIHLNEPLHELPYYFGCLFQGYAGYGGIRLKESVQAEKSCLNSYVRFEPLFPWSDNRGVESLIFLVKRSTLLFETWKARAKERIVSLRDYAETGDDTELQNDRKTWRDWLGLFGAIMVNFPMVLRYVLARLREGAHPAIHVIRMRNFMEMEPNPENRVVLSDEQDVYGQPVPNVYHQTTALDRKSLITLHQILAAEVRSMGLGELSSELDMGDPWPITYDASHHLGTTRMGTEPATSVVTSDCRLHSVENVYMAGASVFPTSGCANPT
ncbi:FAD-dependent oxidoreductase, partial [Candidatus Entotheonella palauensis]